MYYIFHQLFISLVYFVYLIGLFCEWHSRHFVGLLCYKFGRVHSHGGQGKMKPGNGFRNRMIKSLKTLRESLKPLMINGEIGRTTMPC